MDELKPITEDQLQFRRDIEPIIKRFRSYSITMRDAMTELEVVFTVQLAEQLTTIDAQQAMLEQVTHELKQFGDWIGEPLNESVMELVAESEALTTRSKYHE